MLGISIHSQFANQEIEWFATDDSKTYDLNLKSNFEKLSKNGWTNCHFTYKFNQHGFRCNDFAADQSVVFLGCSLTLGVGLPIDSCWSTMVASELCLTHYNLGNSGSSADTAFRLAHYWLPRIKPKLVILCVPDNSRAELLQTDKIFRLGPNIQESFPGKDFYKAWLSDWRNLHLNNKKNILAIETICQRLGIKYVVFESNTIPRTDLARDLIHPGTNSNFLFSKTVLNAVDTES